MQAFCAKTLGIGHHIPLANSDERGCFLTDGLETMKLRLWLLLLIANLESKLEYQA